ncbi:hypothetical protein KSS87_013420 [Heliosperma pusillum]|nr:hypothetical protein KSS87_013420 [Heliosperma pusillum]
MLSRSNSMSWMGGDNRVEENPWNNNNINNNNINSNINNIVVDNVVNDVSLCSFKTMLEVESEWYNNNNQNSGNTSINFTNNELTTENLLLNPGIIDSSSSCSPSPSVFNQTNLDPTQISYLFPSKGNIFSNPLPQSYNLGCVGNGGFFQDVQNNHQISGNNNNNNNNNNGGLSGFTDFITQNEMGSPNLVNNSHFSNTHLIQLGENGGFGIGSSSKTRGFEEGLTNSSLFANRTSKILKPLDNSAPVGAQPTLFQKRAALRKNFSNNNNNSGNSGNIIINHNELNCGDGNNGVKLNCGGENDKKRKIGGSLGILDNVSFTGSEFNYDSDDFTENNDNSTPKGGSDKNGGSNSNANSAMSGGNAGGGDFKGKKKEKLQQIVCMEQIGKWVLVWMDRASILGDAIEYLKELLQKINDLHNELEASPPASTLTQSTNFHPLTPTLPNLPSRIKEELCPSSLPSPNGQPARIEVRLREGRAVNIHMFCGRRPGLLLSTMRALDGLGLDIQQAVISCFNGFAMDIFRAEQCKDGQDVHPEQIKALLLELATFHGSNIVGNCNM